MPEIRIPAQADRLDELLEFVGGAIAEIDMKIQSKINIAIEEVFVNVANYAYSDGNGSVTVRITVDPDEFTARFTDSGTPFDPLAKPDPDTSLSADERTIGGLGIYMVKNLMDSVEYRYENNENTLTIKTRLL